MPEQIIVETGSTVMTLQNILLGGITFLTTALAVVAKKLWEQVEDLKAKSDECIRDRVDLHRKIEGLEAARGIAEGQLQAIGRCRHEECPLKGQK